ncbi:MAG TPA: hypothetical protein VE198_04335 [Actinoallomurus sp.]|nr:hypothetical protein [Actinoallomurus sp.]
MRALMRFLRFWSDFLIGDDWTIALGVVLAVAVTALLAVAEVAAWWLPPIAVIALLGRSLLSDTRTRGRDPVE